MVLVCLHSDALSQHLPSYLGFSINIVKMSILHTKQSIDSMQSLSSYQHNFFTELEQIMSQFVWKYKKTSNSQNNLEKEEWSWRNQPAGLQTLLQSHSHQNSMVLAIIIYFSHLKFHNLESVIFL